MRAPCAQLSPPDLVLLRPLGVCGKPCPESADDPAGTGRKAAPLGAALGAVRRGRRVAVGHPGSRSDRAGHGAAGTLVSVRVPESRPLESYRAPRPGLAVPSGTLVAAFHTDERTSNPGTVYVMERVGDAWKYSAFDSEGRATEHGALALCERCHAESPSGWVSACRADDPPPHKAKTRRGDRRDLQECQAEGS